MFEMLSFFLSPKKPSSSLSWKVDLPIIIKAQQNSITWKVLADQYRSFNFSNR